MKHKVASNLTNLHGYSTLPAVLPLTTLNTEAVGGLPVKVNSADIPVVVTVFPDQYSKTKQAVERSWGEFIEHCELPKEYLSKTDCPLIKLAEFGNSPSGKGCLRHDDNLVTVYGIEGDYDDNEYPIEEAGRRLQQAGIEAFIYSSASYTQTTPRWRLLAPFQEPYTGSKEEMRQVRKNALRRIENLLGLNFANESYTLSQSYYLGRIVGRDWKTFHSEGEVLVADIVKSEIHSPQYFHSRKKLDHKELIKNIHTGSNYHQSMITLAASYVAKGMDRNAAIQTLEGIFESSPLCDSDPKWGERYSYIPTAVDSAINKGFNKNIEWEDTSPSGKVLGTKANLVALLEHVDIDIRLDVYSRRLVAWHDGFEINSNIDALVLDKAVQYGLPKAVVAEQLDTIAEERSVNRPVEWLKSLPKNSDDPLKEWLLDNKLINDQAPAEIQWAYIAFKRWFISACASADQLVNCPIKDAIKKFEHVLVLVGPQGKKKTTAIRNLLPKDLRNYFTEGATLNTDNKDSIIKVTGAWLCELGELDATFRKSDIASLKSFMSNQYDEIRMPYDRRACMWPRRTTYLATVNDSAFLNDITGGRRFWPVQVDSKLVFDEEIGRRIWAQAWRDYCHGEQWWLTDAEEVIASSTRELHDSNHLLEPLQDAFDFDCVDRSNKLKPSEILTALNITGIAVSRQYKHLHAALSLLGIKKASDAVRERRYAMPRKSIAQSLYITDQEYRSP